MTLSNYKRLSEALIELHKLGEMDISYMSHKRAGESLARAIKILTAISATEPIDNPAIAETLK